MPMPPEVPTVKRVNLEREDCLELMADLVKKVGRVLYGSYVLLMIQVTRWLSSRGYHI